MKELDQLRAIFLADDVDPEDRADNERRIKEWEQALLSSEALLSWRDHDVTKQIAHKAKEEYKHTVLELGTKPLTPEMRAHLFALQDAAKWMLSLTEVDAKNTIEQIHKEIQAALNI